jgi:hypothetical protein
MIPSTAMSNSIHCSDTGNWLGTLRRVGKRQRRQLDVTNSNAVHTTQQTRLAQSVTSQVGKHTYTYRRTHRVHAQGAQSSASLNSLTGGRTPWPIPWLEAIFLPEYPNKSPINETHFHVRYVMEYRATSHWGVLCNGMPINIYVVHLGRCARADIHTHYR